MLTLSDNYYKKFLSTKIAFQALKYWNQGLTVCAKLARYMYVYKNQLLIDFEVATAPVPVH